MHLHVVAEALPQLWPHPLPPSNTFVPVPCTCPQPNGWLGALLGTKLYFDMSDRRSIPDKVRLLERELADIKHLVQAGAGDERAAAGLGSVSMGGARMGAFLSPGAAAAGLGVSAWRSGQRPSVIPRTASMSAVQATGRVVRHSVDLAAGGLHGHGFARGAIPGHTRFSRRTSMSVGTSQIGRPSIHIGTAVDCSALEAIRESDRASSVGDGKSLDLCAAAAAAGKDTVGHSRSPADSASAQRENASGVALACMSSLFGNSGNGLPPKPSTQHSHSQGLPQVASITSIVEHHGHEHSTSREDSLLSATAGPVSHRLQFLDMEGGGSLSDSDDEDDGESVISSVRPGGYPTRTSGASSATLADPGWDWSQTMVEQWSLVHVTRWLSDCSLTELVPNFTKHKVCGGSTRVREWEGAGSLGTC